MFHRDLHVSEIMHQSSKYIIASTIEFIAIILFIVGITIHKCKIIKQFYEAKNTHQQTLIVVSKIMLALTDFCSTNTRTVANRNTSERDTNTCPITVNML